jgi:hypothetical protein
MYKKLPKVLFGDVLQEQSLIKRLSDNALIPFDPANTDYAEYLKWLDEGNEPLPADEPEQPA